MKKRTKKSRKLKAYKGKRAGLLRNGKVVPVEAISAGVTEFMIGGSGQFHDRIIMCS